MTFYEFIKSKGFTLRSLAATAGVSCRSLEGHSSGRRSFAGARLKFAVAVARALEIPVEQLMEFDGSKNH